MPKMLKQTLAIILSILIVITTIIAPVYAFAPPSNSGGYDWLDKQYGKWTKDLRDPNTGAIKSGVQVTAKDSRGFISKIIKNPSAGRIAQRLAKGANSVSIALALADLGFEAVDWVLDPENNSVRIKGDGTGYYVTNGVCKTLAASPELSCQLATKVYYPNLHYGLKNGRYVCSGYNNGTWTAPNYDFHVSNNKNCPTADVEIPLDEIARKLQEISETGTGQKQLDAQKVIEETVEEMGEAGELDTELDAAAEPATQPDAETGQCQKGFKKLGEYCYPETDTETEPKPEPQPQPFELPAFCEWTGLCEVWEKTETNTEKTAENTKEIKEHTKSIDDFLHDDKIPIERTEVPFQNEQLQDPSSFDRPYIQAPSQCPDDITAQIPMGLNTVNLVFPMTPICNFGSTFIKPVIIFMSYILGALFIANGFKVG